MCWFKECKGENTVEMPHRVPSCDKHARGSYTPPAKKEKKEYADTKDPNMLVVSRKNKRNKKPENSWIYAIPDGSFKYKMPMNKDGLRHFRCSRHQRYRMEG